VADGATTAHRARARPSSVRPAAAHRAAGPGKQRRCAGCHAHAPRARQAFGEVKTSNAELTKRFGVDAAPALLALCNGDEGAAERYEGQFKAAPIGAWLERFAGGRCAAGLGVATGRRNGLCIRACTCVGGMLTLRAPLRLPARL
jgi:hypothetical protein